MVCAVNYNKMGFEHVFKEYRVLWNMKLICMHTSSALQGKATKQIVNDFAV